MHNMVEFIERGVTLSRLAFEHHCELCDDVQRRHGNAGEAGHWPLASGPRKVRNAVGGLGRRLGERPERRKWCNNFSTPSDIPVLQHRQSTAVTCANDEPQRSAVKSSPRSEI